MPSDIQPGEVPPEEIKNLRNSLEMTQKQFADKLGVKQLTVARWESSERACKGAAAKKIREMQCAATSKLLPTTALATVTSDDLSKLNPDSSIHFFRELLACEARRTNVSVTSIQISPEQIADGGVDCRIEFSNECPDWAGNKKIVCFQIKSGKTCKPWNENWVKTKLLELKETETGHSQPGDEVVRCIEENGLYIAVFTGLHMTSQQVLKSKGLLKETLEKCGFPEIHVDVWGQDQLISLLSPYPSLALQLNGGLDLEFQCTKSWSANHDMSLKYFEDAKQKYAIEEIRKILLKNERVHLIITGDPGIGKTRTILEAVKNDMIAPMAIYVENSEAFLNSKLYNHLLRIDNGYTLVLILDNCPLQISKQVWNTLQNRSNRCKLVTLQTEKCESNDASESVIECSPLNIDTIISIIEHQTGNRSDTRRWGELCSGSPSYAYTLGKNLKINPSSLLSAGKGRHSFLSEDELIVIRHLALFNKFGFGPDYHEESSFVYKLIEDNSGMKRGQIQSIIKKLQHKGFLKGVNTFFITPKIMHIQLWQEFWEFHGDGFSLEWILSDSCPDRLQDWFIDMISYAHLTKRAISKFRVYLNQKAIHHSNNFLTSTKGTALISELAEADPGAVLHFLKLVFDSWSPEQFKSFKFGRQNLVFALGKIAHHSKHFHESSKLLLKLAKSENSTHSNNSLGTFIGLFSLAPGLVAPTSAPPAERLDVLKELLYSPLQDDFEISIKAFQKALSHPIHSGFRIIGPEYQGLNETIALWTPNTEADFQNSLKSYWKFLASSRNSFDPLKQKIIISTLIDSAEYLLLYDWMNELILETLYELITVEFTDRGQLVDIIVSTKNYRSDRVSSNTIEALDRLDKKLTGESLHEEIERYVLYSNYNEFASDEDIETIIKYLVERLIQNPTSLIQVLPKLVIGQNFMIARFFYEIGKQDINRKFFEEILKAYELNNHTTHYCIGGYLKSVFESSKNEWEQLVLPLVKNKNFIPIIGLVINESGITNIVLESLLNNFELMELQINCLLNISHMKEIRKMDHVNIISLIKHLQNHSQYECAFYLIEKTFCNPKTEFPAEFALDLISDYLRSEKCTDISDHSCSELIIYMIKHKFYPSDLFKHLVDRLFNTKHLMSHHNALHEIILNQIKDDPKRCWEALSAKFDADNDTTQTQHALRMNFSSININVFPEPIILRWVAEKPCPRASFIARLIPHNLSCSNGGSLGRELLNRYGEEEEFQLALISNYLSGDWCGNLKNLYQSKYEIAAQWLKEETSLRVRQFLEKYIDILLGQIEWAERATEREF